MSTAPPIAVFDTSALITWTRSRLGYQEVEAFLLDATTTVYLHKQNAMEFWYQTHRTGALATFINTSPERVQSDGRVDMTGLDFDDLNVFNPVAGQLLADEKLAEIQAVGVQIVGDEQFPDLWRRAGELKSKFRRVSLADCFGVALAIELAAPFWTTDRHELTALDTAQIAHIHFVR